MQSFRTKVLRNSTFNFLGWLVPIALSLFTIPFFIKELTSEGYGAWVIVSSLTGYFSLVQLGIGPAVIKFIAEYKAKNDFRKIQDITNASVLFSAIVGLASGIVIYLLAPFLAHLFNFPSHLWNDVIQSIRIGGVFFPVFLLSNVYFAVFVGYQRYDISNVLNIVRIVLTAVISCSLLIIGYGIVGLVISTALVNSLTVFFCQLFLPKIIEGYKFNISRALKTIQKIFGYSAFTFISQIAQLLNSRLAEILIGILIGPSAVTYFSVPARLVGLFGSGTSSLTSVLFPFASELQSEGNHARTKRTFLQSTRFFNFLIVPFYFTFILFSKPILELWLSKDIAAASYMIMSLYSLAYLISGLTIVPSQFLQGFGKVKFISQFSIGIIFVSVLGYLPLIKMFGLIGAGYAVLLSQLFSILFIYYSLKVVGVSVKEYLLSIFTAFMFGVISLVPVILLQTVLASYLPEMVAGLVLIVLFFTIYATLCFFFSEIGPKFKKIAATSIHWRPK